MYIEFSLIAIATCLFFYVVLKCVEFALNRSDAKKLQLYDKSVAMLEEANLNLQKELSKCRDRIDFYAKETERYKNNYHDLHEEYQGILNILEKIYPELSNLNEYYKTVAESSRCSGQDVFEIKNQRDMFIKQVGSLLRSAEDSGFVLDQSKLDDTVTHTVAKETE